MEFSAMSDEFCDIVTHAATSMNLSHIENFLYDLKWLQIRGYAGLTLKAIYVLIKFSSKRNEHNIVVKHKQPIDWHNNDGELVTNK